MKKLLLFTLFVLFAISVIANPGNDTIDIVVKANNKEVTSLKMPESAGVCVLVVTVLSGEQLYSGEVKRDVIVDIGEIECGYYVAFAHNNVGLFTRNHFKIRHNGQDCIKRKLQHSK